MDEELKTYLTEMKREMTEMKIGLADMKSELIQHTEAVKTRLLGEFWTWTRTADMRYQQANSAVGFLNERLQAIEDRVSELERRRAR